MKVIFLDYDGVLNVWNREDKYHTPVKMVGEIMTMAEPDLVYRLNLIVDRTGCEIVLSSAWRHSPDWREAMRKSGIVKHILDKTPSFPNAVRGYEIQHWLDEHLEVEKYAIIDDGSDMLDCQLPNFFLTQNEYGLTQEIADRIEKHLSPTPTKNATT